MDTVEQVSPFKQRLSLEQRKADCEKAMTQVRAAISLNRHDPEYAAELAQALLDHAAELSQIVKQIQECKR